MTNVRGIARNLFYRYPWAVTAGGIVSFCALAALAYLHSSWPVVLTGIAIFGCVSFIWGYSTRALKNIRYPSLDHLHRRKYAEVWDTLAASPTEARAAACGTQSETALRESAAVPVKNIFNLATLNKNEDVLEIGCGVGRIGFELASLCRSWTGADISQNMLTEASRRLRELPNVRLVRLEKVGLEQQLKLQKA